MTAPLNAGSVLQAYQSLGAGGATQTPAAAPEGEGFASLLNRALDGAISTGHQADAQAAQAVAGHGDLTHVVTAVSQAQLALQTTVSIRDRVLQAYQDIMKMPI